MRAAVAFAVLASLSSCKKKEDDAASKATQTAPVKVVLAAAEQALVPDVLTLTGVIAADQRSEVTADTQGKVVAVLVERGQRVKMGDPVVRLDVRTAALSAREAQANLEAARAQKQLAEEECRRTQTLLDKGAITRSEYDRQATQCTSTLQQVSAAQARADMITKSISDGLVRAPFAGVVTEKAVAPGEWVAPGRTLFTLVDDDPLRIELSVPEAAVRAIRKGQRVELSAVAQGSKTYLATVTRIGGEIGRNRALIVEATLDAQHDLVPGMFAEAHLEIGCAATAMAIASAEDAEAAPAAEPRSTAFKPGSTQLDITRAGINRVIAARDTLNKPRPAPPCMRAVVPAGAVVKRGKVHHVFIAVGGELQDHIVQVGAAPAPGKLSILQGVNQGDKVVAQVTSQIHDGLRVVE